MTRRAVRSIAVAACMTGAVLAVMAMSGCGQKGPLFLPEVKREEIERKRDEKKPDKTSRMPAALQVWARA